LKEDWIVSEHTNLTDVPAALRRHGVQQAQSELSSV
jgi:hypothetical protein